MIVRIERMMEPIPITERKDIHLFSQQTNLQDHIYGWLIWVTGCPDDCDRIVKDEVLAFEKPEEMK